MLPLIRKAYTYGKPLAKKIGKFALGALAGKATNKIAGTDYGKYSCRLVPRLSKGVKNVHFWGIL
jgi:hypothetical protein